MSKPRKSYYEKLKDPRWQKKRLEIMERDKFTCQRCLSTESTLHVHHRKYVFGKEPWDYENEFLVTLCEDCHFEEQESWKVETSLLSNVLHIKGLFSDDVCLLSIALHEAPATRILIAMMERVTRDPEAYWWLFDRYYKEGEDERSSDIVGDRQVKAT